MSAIRRSNLSDSIFTNGVVSLSNFALIFLSANGLNAIDNGVISLILSTLFGIQMVYMSFFYISSHVEVGKGIDKQNLRTHLVVFNIILSFILVAIVSLTAIYSQNFSNLTIILAAVFIFSQLLSDHCRLEAYLFDVDNLLVWPIFLNFITKIIGVYFSNDINTTLIILFLSNLLILPRLANIIVIKSISTLFDFNFLLMHIRYSGKITLAAMFNWVWGFFPVYIIGYFHGIAYSGILLALRSLGNIHQPITSLMDNYLLNKLESSDLINKQKVKNLIDFYIIYIWTIFFIIIWLFGAEILEFIFGVEYKDYGLQLSILWISSGFFLLAKNKINFIRMTSKNLSIDFNTAIVAVVVSIAGIPLVYFYKILGAAILYSLVTCLFYTYTVFLHNEYGKK